MFNGDSCQPSSCSHGEGQCIHVRNEDGCQVSTPLKPAHQGRKTEANAFQ